MARCWLWSVRTPEQSPGAIAWCIAVVSLALPWFGLGLGLAGSARIYGGLAHGWWLLLAGIAAIVLDILIDFVWAHPSISRSDQPALNQRAAQAIGRIYVVEEAIVAGRGKVRIGDTLWPVSGREAPAGAHVKVTAVKGTVLQVEAA
jgi:membrane protein implicated in regulation of membrane protease activity